MDEDYGLASSEEWAPSDATGENDVMPLDAFDLCDGDEMDDDVCIDPQFAREVFGLRYVSGDSEKVS